MGVGVLGDTFYACQHDGCACVDYVCVVDTWTEEERARWRESGAFKKEYRDQLKATKLFVESYTFLYEDAKWIATGLLTGWTVPDPSVNINQIMSSIL